MTDYSKYKESAFTHEEMQQMIMEIFCLVQQVLMEMGTMISGCLKLIVWVMSYGTTLLVGQIENGVVL